MKPFKQQRIERRGQGTRASPLPSEAAKPKAKKRRVLGSYHGFCGINGTFAHFTISGGVRILSLPSIVVEQFLTTTC